MRQPDLTLEQVLAGGWPLERVTVINTASSSLEILTCPPNVFRVVVFGWAWSSGSTLRPTIQLFRGGAYHIVSSAPTYAASGAHTIAVPVTLRPGDALYLIDRAAIGTGQNCTVGYVDILPPSRGRLLP